MTSYDNSIYIKLIVSSECFIRHLQNRIFLRYKNPFFYLTPPQINGYIRPRSNQIDSSKQHKTIRAKENYC